MPYKTTDSDYILPTALHKKAIQFAKEITGNDRPTMESGLFIETFKACFQIMQELGMVKDEYMVAEKPDEFDEY
jgi:hypothetical protein